MKKRLAKLAQKAVAVFVAVEGWVDMAGLGFASYLALQSGMVPLAIGLGLWSLSHLVMFGYASYATWRY